MKSLYTKNNYWYFFGVLLLSFISCEEMLEEEVFSSFTELNYYRTPSDAEGALTAAYSSLRDVVNDYWEINSNSSEIASGRLSNSDPGRLDDFTKTSENIRIESFWRATYVAINLSNVIIDRVPDIKFEDDGRKNEIIAEARFLRAFHYFNLVRFFGDVPLETSETIRLNDIYKARTSKDVIYDEVIIPDLNYASDNLPDLANASTGRVGKGAAQAMLGKVYLTRENYEAAKTELEKVIGKYSLEEDFSDLWNGNGDNSNEFIFSLQYNSEPGLGSNLHRRFGPEGGGINGVSVQSDTYAELPFYNNFPQGVRFEVTFRDYYVIGGTDTIKYQDFAWPFPHCDKYWDENVANTGDSGVDFPFLRYADVVLMYAETLNETEGPTIEAYDQINQIRRRAAGMDINNTSAVDLTPGLSKDQFSDSLFVERMWELCWEGHELFDLFRTHRLERLEVSSAATTNFPNNIVIDEARDYALPIPRREIDINPNLIQNLGYN